MYNCGGLATRHPCEFVLEPGFVDAYTAAARVANPPIGSLWQTEVALWSAAQAALTPGVFVVCGIENGFLPLAIAQYLSLADHPDRRLVLLEPSDRAADADMLSLRETMESIPNAVLHHGSLGDILPDAVPVAGVIIGLREGQQALTAVTEVWPRMVSGALMLVAAYGHPERMDLHRSVSAFLQAQGVAVLMLPTGQALVLKP
jgi:hypothetical protein